MTCILHGVHASGPTVLSCMSLVVFAVAVTGSSGGGVLILYEVDGVGSSGTEAVEGLLSVLDFPLPRPKCSTWFVFWVSKFAYD